MIKKKARLQYTYRSSVINDDDETKKYDDTRKKLQADRCNERNAKKPNKQKNAENAKNLRIKIKSKLEEDQATLIMLHAKVTELENELAECKKLNESMVSSLNTNLPNKGKYTVMKTKQLVRKSKRISSQRIPEVTDKSIVIDYILSISSCRDGNNLDDKPDLVKQNKLSGNRFKWIPVYKDKEKKELIRNTIVYVHDGKMIPWFEVRKSTIADAGWGLFSLQKFVKDEVMGRYLGFKVEQGAGGGVYTVATDNFTIDCFSYPKVFTGHGVHLANDPNWNRDGEICKKFHLIVNASIKADFVMTCDAEIFKIDDEIFYVYNYIEE